jgi:hypothetical protein
MTAQLTKIRALEPQAIVNWSIGPTQVIILRNWRELGMERITFFQSHGFGSRHNIELAAGAAKGFTARWAPAISPRCCPPITPKRGHHDLPEGLHGQIQ